MKQVLILFSTMFLFCSCDDFVEVELPDSQLTAPAVFEDKYTATAALTSIYSKIRDYGVLSGSPGGLSHSLGLYTDELIYYGSSSSPTDFYTNSLTSSDVELKALWTTSYNQIYAVNAVIYGLDNSTSISLADRKVIKGEALFTRALLHFYLVNLYGEIPYITSTDYLTNSTISKLPEEEVYGFIKSDLSEALLLLPTSYINTSRTRPNVYTAHALRSRVNLYLGLWAEASNEASAVINETSLFVMNDISTTFKKNNLGTIWQLSPANILFSTAEANTFIFKTGPPPRSAISPTLLMSFEPNDLRKSQWLKLVIKGDEMWYHPYKYRKTTADGNQDEQSILFRLEEQYLTRAEARARQGELTGAKEDLNKIRNRSGLTNTIAATSDELVLAILEERRHEFFTELGHRFFDLKRTGRLSVALTASKPDWDEVDLLFPIPATELLLNPNLKPQNAGY